LALHGPVQSDPVWCSLVRCLIQKIKCQI
jgi:hypothetical protein